MDNPVDHVSRISAIERDPQPVIKSLLFPPSASSGDIKSLCVKEDMKCAPPGKRRIGKPAKTKDVGHSCRTCAVACNGQCSEPSGDIGYLCGLLGWALGRSQDHVYSCRIVMPARPEPQLSHLM